MQKVARKEAENAKVAVRNIRRDVLGDIKEKKDRPDASHESK